MEKDIILEKIKKWLMMNSYTGFKFEASHYESIYQTTEMYISIEEKNGIELWLEYFLTMNFSKDKFVLIETIIDNNFFEDKFKAINNKVYENVIINILLKASIAEVFENNLYFNENEFIMNIDKLSKQLKTIIKYVFQTL